MPLPRMRTAKKAAEEIKKLDPDTDVTAWAIMRLMKSGRVPMVKAGNKFLVNLDTLLDYYAKGEKQEGVEVSP